MSFPLALALGALFSAASANMAPVRGPTPENDLIYTNERFGFVVTFPKGLFPLVEETGDGAGIVARTRGGTAELRAYAAPIDSPVAKKVMREARRGRRHWMDPGGLKVYGTKHGERFYREVFVREKSVNVLYLRYPEKMQSAYDGIAKAISLAFRPRAQGGDAPLTR